MAIRFKCSCGTVLSVPETAAGQKGTCKVCGIVMTVPAQSDLFLSDPGGERSVHRPLAAAAPAAPAPAARPAPAKPPPPPARPSPPPSPAPAAPSSGAEDPPLADESARGDEDAVAAAAPSRGAFRAPAWFISGAVHALLLFIATLIAWAVEQPASEPVRALVIEPPKKIEEREIKMPEKRLEEIRPAVPNPMAPADIEVPHVVQNIEETVKTTTPEMPTPELTEATGMVGDPNAFLVDPSATASSGGMYAVMGAGGGTPGSGGGTGGGSAGFAHRIGTGKRLLIGKFGGNQATESAVDAALRWLSNHQNRDGHWEIEGPCDNDPKCTGHGGYHITHPNVKEKNGFDVAVTSLAVLAFLGAGHTEHQGPYASNVRRALYWLEEHQDPATGKWPGSHYTQSIATLAVGEAFGMSGGHRDMAQKAVAYLSTAQNPWDPAQLEDPGGGWNYHTTKEPGPLGQFGDKKMPMWEGGDDGSGRHRNDTSITGWAVMATKSAKLSGLSVDPRVFEGALHHFQSIGGGGTDGRGGTLYYAFSKPKNYDGGFECPKGCKDVWQAKPGKCPKCGSDLNEYGHDAVVGNQAIRAISALCLLYLNRPVTDPFLIEQAEIMKRFGAHMDSFYYSYYGTLAMFQMGGDYWEAWNKSMRDPLLARQVKNPGADDDGSWDHKGDSWGNAGGRVFTTALGAMMLEVYYRYMPIYQK